MNNLEGGSILCILPKAKSGRLQKGMEKGLISCTRGGKKKKNLDLEADVRSVCSG